jgi:hypothetical protein
VSEDALTGSDLEEQLRTGTVSRHEIRISGMVKASENAGYIAFAQRDCESWVDVPTDLIEKAERVGQRPCRDHSHPVFALSLREPEGDVAKLYATLLAASTPAAPTPTYSDIASSPYSNATLASRSLSPNPLPGLGGGWGAWGCWESRCCTKWDLHCDPAAPGLGGCILVCTAWGPCTRCIWPW